MTITYEGMGVTEFLTAIMQKVGNKPLYNFIIIAETMEGELVAGGLTWENNGVMTPQYMVETLTRALEQAKSVNQ